MAFSSHSIKSDHSPSEADETTALLAVSETDPFISANEEVIAPETHPNEVGLDDDEDKPLPIAQIFLLCYARIVEPIAFFSIFPFVNKMIWETGGLDEADVGFYSGLIVSSLHTSRVWKSDMTRWRGNHSTNCDAMRRNLSSHWRRWCSWFLGDTRRIVLEGSLSWCFLWLEWPSRQLCLASVKLFGRWFYSGVSLGYLLAQLWRLEPWYRRNPLKRLRRGLSVCLPSQETWVSS